VAAIQLGLNHLHLLGRDAEQNRVEQLLPELSRHRPMRLGGNPAQDVRVAEAHQQADEVMVGAVFQMEPEVVDDEQVVFNFLLPLDGDELVLLF
jgi:hypothetical protein